MSRAIDNRLRKLEALNLNVTTTMQVHRHDDDAVLFSRTIRYLDPAQIHLRWPERNEVVESIGDHCEGSVPGRNEKGVQHRSTDAVI